MTYKEFLETREKLAEEYDIRLTHVDCYLEHFFDRYLCVECPRFDTCEIMDEECKNYGTSIQ